MFCQDRLGIGTAAAVAAAAAADAAAAAAAAAAADAAAAAAADAAAAAATAAADDDDALDTLLTALGAALYFCLPYCCMQSCNRPGCKSVTRRSVAVEIFSKSTIFNQNKHFNVTLNYSKCTIFDASVKNRRINIK